MWSPTLSEYIGPKSTKVVSNSSEGLLRGENFLVLAEFKGVYDDLWLPTSLMARIVGGKHSDSVRPLDRRSRAFECPVVEHGMTSISTLSKG